MALSLSPVLFERFSERLADCMGLYFPKDRWPELERGMTGVAAALGTADVSSCVQRLLATDWGRTEIELLAGHLTIGETYFFREPQGFEVLSQQILPNLIGARQHAGRDIRIWSAACCTGEEAYSLAIVLDRLIQQKADWTIRILATDINPEFLRRAALGVYSDWSFRGVPDSIKKTYFNSTPRGGYEVIPRIKKMVTFMYDNIVDANASNKPIEDESIDILFCRNVLMYFREDVARGVIERFHRVLHRDGWLFPGSVEGIPALFRPFCYVNMGGATLYRKESALLESARSAVPTPAPKTVMAVPLPAIVAEATPALPRPATPAPVVVPQAYSPSLALDLYQKGRYGEATAVLRQQLEDDPENVTSLLLLARTKANQGYLADARRWCEQAIACDRLHPASHYFLALIQQEQGELEEAAASFQRVLFLDGHFVLAHFALANLARQRGHPEEAARHYRNMAALLEGQNSADVLPESEGMTVGNMLDLARRHAGMSKTGKSARIT